MHTQMSVEKNVDKTNFKESHQNYSKHEIGKHSSK